MFDFIKRAIVPPAGRCLINSISSSLKMRVVGYENYRFVKEMGKKCVIVFWHGQQFYPIYHFRNHKIAIMVSLSRDGEIQNRILSSFGYEVVRGSSSRGAVSGLIGMIKKMREGYDLAIALDGPRGPFQTAKEGVNYIAIKEDCFILPIACAFTSYKQFNAWDRYILPYPYAGGVMLVGRPIMPNKLNIPAMTHKHLEKILIAMTAEAESMLNPPAADFETGAGTAGAVSVVTDGEEVKPEETGADGADETQPGGADQDADENAAPALKDQDEKIIYDKFSKDPGQAEEADGTDEIETAEETVTADEEDNAGEEEEYEKQHDINKETEQNGPADGGRKTFDAGKSASETIPAADAEKKDGRAARDSKGNIKSDKKHSPKYD